MHLFKLFEKMREMAIGHAHMAPLTGGLDALLEGAQFADAFRILARRPYVDAREVAELMFGRSPRWIDGLMAARNRIVGPLGLKTPVQRHISSDNAIGAFPVVSVAPARVVVGFDDVHLDFRVVVDIAASEFTTKITTTTLVRTHNRLGHGYLCAILPFHRLIVKTLLKQAAEAV